MTSIEMLMNWYEQRAILARRPYPPIDLPDFSSHLGGLPTLQSPELWPRASDGTPLHFLARIDCSELPEARGPLPTSGVLQFFARIDEEMIWDGDPSDYARVLYNSTLSRTETAPPEDLPPLEGGWHSFDREMRLPDEPHRKLYPKWPLSFESIKTWPIGPPIDPESGIDWRDYRTAVERAQAAEVVRTTGWSIKSLLNPRWGNWAFDKDGQTRLVLPDHGSSTFPQAWIIVDRISRKVTNLASEKIGKLRDQPQPTSQTTSTEQGLLMSDLERMSEVGLSWVRRAAKMGLHAPTQAAEAQEFIDWIKPLSRDSRYEISGILKQSIERGMSSAVNYCGGSLGAAQAIPVVYMNCLEDEHSLCKADNFAIEVQAPRRWISTEHHQLLGHAAASQDIGTRTSNDVLLLHLVSDRGVDFMFCDCGEIQFWIDANDLIAKRFDRVKVSTQGG